MQENKAPGSAASSVAGGDAAKFAIPGSRLKMPKSYPASSTSSSATAATSTKNVSTRSRSSSRTRTRNVLGSAN